MRVNGQEAIHQILPPPPPYALRASGGVATRNRILGVGVSPEAHGVSVGGLEQHPTTLEIPSLRNYILPEFNNGKEVIQCLVK